MVPLDLKPQFNKDHIKISLRTGPEQKAINSALMKGHIDGIARFIWIMKRRVDHLYDSVLHLQLPKSLTSELDKHRG